MEIKFLVSLVLLEAIFNNANLIITPDSQLAQCSKGNFNNDNLVKARDHALNQLYEAFGFRSFVYNSFHEVNPGNGIWAKRDCPPNIKKEDCRECVRQTIPILKKTCPKQNQGVAWSVTPKLYCMVHYQANGTHTEELGGKWVRFFPLPAHPPAPGNIGELEKGLNNLANKLKEIVKGVPVGGYGSGSISYGSGSYTLYGSAHCFQHQSNEECMKCLSEATNQLHDCCSKLRKQIGKVFSVYCGFWYAHANFLSNTLSTISVTPPHISG